MSKPEPLANILATLEAAATRKRFKKIEFFTPYAKQQAFLDASSWARERLFMAANQIGKSETGAYEAAVHLTGLYPPDWFGRRWERPVKAWCAGESSLLVRDVSQKKLCGEPGVEADFGTGMVPLADFVDKPSLSRGVTDAYDTIQVKHYTNGVKDGVSIARFKSYEQGRKKFQGETIDFAWLDEEPPEDIYTEILTRITATKGMLFTTFTPLNGKTSLVKRFTDEKSPDRSMTTMTLADALHVTPEEREKIVAGYPVHEREARSKGVPMLGSGRIFSMPEEAITEPDLTYIPPHWVKLWGVDFGIDHPFAAVLIIWDRDNDVIHVHKALRMRNMMPISHAYAMKQIGRNVPVAWPHDGAARDKGSLEPLKDQYKKHGLRMRDKHATFPDGSNGTEAGILEMEERMQTGRFKVAASLVEWFEEYRMYHRKDGMIVKLDDDLLSATRIAVMDKRHAGLVVLGSEAAKRRNDGQARDVDFDIFG